MPFQNYLPGFEPAATADAPLDRLRDLGAFPDVAPEALHRHEMTIGKAGEKFVDSLLLRWGEEVVEPPEGLSYDRLILRPRAAIRVQVKTSAGPRPGGFYSFEMRRGFHGSAGGTRPYEPTDYHLAALVCLDRNIALFTAERRPRHRLEPGVLATLRARPRESYREALERLGIPPHDEAVVPASAA